MDLYAWLVSASDPVDPASLPSSTREPPEFLKINKTKPSKRPLSPGPSAPDAFPLTPLESRLKDIIVSVYSDKRKARSPEPEARPLHHQTSSTLDATTSVEGPDSLETRSVSKPKPIDSQTSGGLDITTSVESGRPLQEDIVSSDLQLKSLDPGARGVLQLPQTLTRPHPDGSEAPTLSGKSHITSYPNFERSVHSQSTKVTRRSPEGQVKEDTPGPSTGPNHKLAQGNSGHARMSDTRSTTSTENLSSSAPIFSADDQNIDLVDPDFSPVSPSNQLGSLPYSDSEPGTYLHGGQNLGPVSVLPGDDRSHPVSLDFLNSSPGLLYSFTDPSSTSGRKAGSGHSDITNSFGVSPNLYQPRLAKPRQLRSTTAVGSKEHGNKGHSSKVHSHAVEDTDAPPPPPPANGPELKRPLFRAEGESRDVTPTPESTRDVDSTEQSSSEPASGVLYSVGHTSLTLPSHDSLQALSGETASTDSDSEQLPVMDSDVETSSVVSVRQLTETYLNEPPADFIPDVTTPLSEGGKIPFTLPMGSPSLSRTLSSELPKLSPGPQVGTGERAHSMLSQRDEIPIPSQSTNLSSESPRLTPAAQDLFRTRNMLSQHDDELPSPGKIPAHINQSTSRGSVRSPHSGGSIPRSLGRTASFDDSQVATPGSQGEEPELEALERKLEEEQRSRIYLEGQLQAVKEECDVALQERPKLVSSLSRAEAELAEMAAALEVERKRHKLAPETSLEESPAAKKTVKKLRDAEQTLAQEKRALSNLRGRLGKEEQKSRQLEKNLEDATQSLQDQELDVAKLREKLQQSHAEMTQKADKYEELACRLSSLGASYDALEQNKCWLHDQLQEAQRAKLKLQEELRESKASGIAHKIKCDQLEKEGMAHQEKISDLLQGVLQDKAKMVTQLETIKEDVLSHEDLYAKLIAEKTQLEDTVRRKDEALAELGLDMARARVEREELEQKLGEAHSTNEQLEAKNGEMGRDNKRLSHKLGASFQDLEEKESDLREVEKIKASLQEKLRNTDAELAGKDGTIHSLKETNDLLQQEVVLVNDTKGSLEGELAESKRELALLEADLKSTLEKGKVGDARLRGMLESRHSVDGEKQALHRLLEGKNRELEQKEEEIRSMEAQMSELVRDFGSLQANFKTIASESGSVNNSIAEKDRVISHLSSEKDVRDEELHSLGTENEDLHEKLAELQHEKAHLLGQVEGSVDQGDYKKALQEKAQLQEELNSLKLDQKRDEIKASAKISRLENDLKAAQKEASKARKELEISRDELNKELSQTNEARRKMEADLTTVNERLQAAIGDKEKAESVLSSLKPSEHKMQEVLKAKCERLEERSVDLAEQLQQLAQQKAEVERASGLVAAKLKQNADREKKKLAEKNREVSFELERLRGRLAGMQATQVTVRDHATSLEAALAKKESLIVKLSAEAQKVLEDKSRDDEAFRTQIGALESQLKEVNADLDFQREQAEAEKRRAEELETEMRENKSSDQTDQCDTDPKAEVSHLSERLAALSSEKEILQSDVSYLKSQLLISKTSAESAKRQIVDRASQVEILEQELRISESRCQQAEEEVKQLQEHLKARKVRNEVGGKGSAGAKSLEESIEQPGSLSGLGTSSICNGDSVL